MTPEEVIADSFSHETGYNDRFSGEAAKAILTALSNAGFVVVPREPTEAMIEAWEGAKPDDIKDTSAKNWATADYKAMLSAYEENK